MTLQMTGHIIVYGELLFRLGLLHKRSELLKCLPKDSPFGAGQHETNTEELSEFVCFWMGLVQVPFQ